MTNAVEVRLYLWGQAAGDYAGIGRSGAANSTNVFDLTAFGVLRESVPPATPLDGTTGVTYRHLTATPGSNVYTVAAFDDEMNLSAPSAPVAVMVVPESATACALAIAGAAALRRR